MNPLDSLERPIHVVVGGATDTGRKRRENQDSFLAVDLSPPLGEPRFLLAPQTPAERDGGFALGLKGALLLVADGMGGAAGGALASRMAVEAIAQDLATRWCAERSSSPQLFGARLREAVELANAAIHNHAAHDARLRGMGSTATAVGLLENYLYLAHVGDSRAYLIRRREPVQLTRDQSLVQELVASGALTEQEAETSPHRNVLLQALGTARSVRVEVGYHELHRGDVIALCSDGLYRVVQHDEIAHALGAADDLAAACTALVELANERGGPDNVTVLAARLHGDGLRPA